MENEVDQYLTKASTTLSLLNDLHTPSTTDFWYFHKVYKIFPQFDRIVIVNSENTIIQSAPKGLTGIDFPIDFPLGLQGLLSRPRLDPIRGELVLYMRMSFESRAFIGELGLKSMHQSIQKILADSPKKLILMDNYGNLILHPDPQAVQEQRNLGNLSILKKNSHYWWDGFFTMDNTPYWGSTLKMDNPKWTILLYEDRNILVNRMTIQGISFGAVFSLVLILLMFFIQREIAAKIISPLSRFTQLVAQQGNSETPKEIQETVEYNELAILQGALNGMSQKLYNREERLTNQNHLLNQQKQDLEYLIKEVHHRTKNNLNTIISLLSLQASVSNQEEVKRVLEESSNRIKTISSLHDLLHNSQNLEQINLKNYIEVVVQGVDMSFNSDYVVRYELDLVNGIVPPALAIQNGLVINELLTNSLKYAFTPDCEGTISITLSEISPSTYNLIYQDNGIGMDKREWENPDGSSLGIEIIKSIIQSQMESYCTFSGENGFRLEWKISV